MGALRIHPTNMVAVQRQIGDVSFNEKTATPVLLEAIQIPAPRTWITQKRRKIGNTQIRQRQRRISAVKTEGGEKIHDHGRVILKNGNGRILPTNDHHIHLFVALLEVVNQFQEGQVVVRERGTCASAESKALIHESKDSFALRHRSIDVDIPWLEIEMRDHKKSYRSADDASRRPQHVQETIRTDSEGIQ